jgi:hypothetical protein
MQEDEQMIDRISDYYRVLVRWLERLLALVVVGGVVVYAIGSVPALAGMDWQTSAAFYELIYRALLIAIGLELVRMLVVHDLMSVLELLAFVIARKMLKPDLMALDIALAVLAFVALLGARRFLLAVPSPQGNDKPSDGVPSPGHLRG